jgi:hypothetical protein
VSVPVLHSIDSNGGKLQVQLVLTFIEKVVALEQMIVLAEFPIKRIV